MKLLIVDDSLVIRRALERSLKFQSFESIQSAQNGAIALKLFKENPADVVTMDITMPEMDGLTCIESIIKINPSTRILVITALADKGTAVEAVKRGAQGFLLKPFTADDVNEALIDLLEDL